MELGEKLRAARMEAGLTQKQLCENIVTRNMLSQIENGLARPSMKTLELFARRLGKTLSWFLEETAVLSPNTPVMEEARKLFDTGAYAKASEALKNYHSPDPVYDREKTLLQQLCLLEAARLALQEGKDLYARELLTGWAEESAYCTGEIHRSRLLLLGRIQGEHVSSQLPSLDEELILRAREALDAGKAVRAEVLLDACENQTDPQWAFLRGKCHLDRKSFEQAKIFLLQAENHGAADAVPLLEICFRELGDYQNAYLYACKQRK